VCADDGDCPVGTECIDGSCFAVGVDVPIFPLSPPENLAAIAIDDRSVLLTWTDNDPAATSFQIERAEDGDEPQPITISGPISPSGTTDDSGLQEGVTYVYQVRAQGDGLSDSDPSDTSSATVLPATPVSFTATAVSNSQIDLSWTNASTVATEFRLQERVGGTFTDIPLLDPTSNTFSHTNLIAGTTHEYRVFAKVDGFENSQPQVVNSLPSAIRSATTTAVSTVAFAAPPGTFTTDQASAAGEGICLVQRFSSTLLVRNVTGTQVRLTLRGANAGNLTLDRITISGVGTAGDPYDSAPDLTDLTPGVATTVAAGGTATVGPVSYNFDSNQDLLVAVDISNIPGQGNLRFGGLNGTDTFARTATAEAGVQDRGPNYITAANNLFLIETIEVL
jgi:hypothetical protein